MTLSELCKKDVIQLTSGVNLGRVDDLEFDRISAEIQSLVLFGRPQWFGLLGRQQDVHIPWADVTAIGADVVLVKTELPEEPERTKKGILSKWFA